MGQGIVGRRIADMPIAVLDFETTGMFPGRDRVVEAAVVRIDPGEAPRLVFDSLVNPARRMDCTEIHGIRDRDVATAPGFRDIAGELLAALEGCVLAAYNASFDVKFLEFELRESGVRQMPPHLCLMYLRPLLGLGTRCKLEEACRRHGIDYSATHAAADDARAAASLYAAILPQMNDLGVRTFGELARLRKYKFAESFVRNPLPDPSALGVVRNGRVVSRAGFSLRADPLRQAQTAYWTVLRKALTEWDLSDEGAALVQAERLRGGLSDAQIRALHARAFATALSRFTKDSALDEDAARRLAGLHRGLARLGWAPGG